MVLEWAAIHQQELLDNWGRLHNDETPQNIGVFDALQQIGSFAKVAVDSESGTLVWPNGVDFCPDVLYAEATGKDIEELGNVLEVVQTFPIKSPN